MALFLWMAFSLPKRIALLPPKGPNWIERRIQTAVRRLGVELVALKPEELVNPKIFNPSRFPIAIYAGFEEYVRTVNEEGDGERAILRFLSQGGFLIVAGQCWPFYTPLDRKGTRFERDRPTVFSNRLELFISGPGTKGFEEPPERIILCALQREVLPLIPSQWPFPSSGDLRYRPISGEGLPPEDRFLPLITARGESGTDYGPAAALIEHHCKRFKGAKVLYLWHGLWLTVPRLGEQVLSFALWSLASPEERREAEEWLSQAKREGERIDALISRLEAWPADLPLKLYHLNWCRSLKKQLKEIPLFARALLRRRVEALMERIRECREVVEERLAWGK